MSGAIRARAAQQAAARADRDPLIVAARDPQLPLHRITDLPPGELVALCRACYTRRTNAVKKKQQTAAEQPSLFDCV